MKKTAFIWRESVYKGNFKCNHCGTDLATPDAIPLGTTLFDTETGNLFCPKCRNWVAKTREIDAPETMVGKQGLWDDFVKEQMN